jgi:hypothetical protein
VNAALKKLPSTVENIDERLDQAERARRLCDLIAAPVLPWGDVALFLNLPLSTLNALRAQGRGPQSFLLGRRIYVRQSDMRAWLDRMATESPA